MGRMGGHWRRQKGFSLIELIVVVGIIGIGVTIAMPQLQKFVRRSKQAEAKHALASIHALQKQFFSYYYAYHMGMDAIAYRPLNVRLYGIYNCVGGSWTNLVSGYVGPGGATQYINTINVPPLSGLHQPGCAATWLACSAVPNNPQVYKAVASGQLRGGYYEDIWTIDQDKTLLHCSNGL